MDKWSELILGLILVIGAILLAWHSAAYSWMLFGKSFNFLTPAWIVLKGSIFWIVLGIGILLILLGISDIKE